MFQAWNEFYFIAKSRQADWLQGFGWDSYFTCLWRTLLYYDAIGNSPCEVMLSVSLVVPIFGVTPVVDEYETLMFDIFSIEGQMQVQILMLHWCLLPLIQ